MTEILNRRALAQKLGVSESLIQKWPGQGKGPAMVKLGARRVGYRIADVEAWLSRQVRGGETDTGADA